MQLKRRIRFVDCVEKVLWPIERVKSSLQSFCAGAFLMDYASQVEQLIDSNQMETLIDNNIIPCER